MDEAPHAEERAPAAAENAEWIGSLRSDDTAKRDAAIRRLHELLLRASRFEVQRRQKSLPHLRGGDLDDLALQSANDALVAVLRKLPDFRGESRFTTWAYKFAIYESAVKLRRRAWQGRELPVSTDGWSQVPANGALEEEAERSALLEAVQQALEGALSDHQRTVLVSTVLAGVPIDVLAERLGTTRGALYKTLHDARRKLRKSLAAEGFELQAVARD